jgi:hypothetical protein
LQTSFRLLEFSVPFTQLRGISDGQTIPPNVIQATPGRGVGDPALWFRGADTQSSADIEACVTFLIAPGSPKSDSSPLHTDPMVYEAVRSQLSDAISWYPDNPPLPPGSGRREAVWLLLAGRPFTARKPVNSP